MWLRLLVPLTLMWPVLALAAEGTSLNRYRSTPGRELLALVFCILTYFIVWLLVDRVFESMIGIVAGIIAATLLSLAALPFLLFVGFKIFGVRRGETPGPHT